MVGDDTREGASGLPAAAQALLDAMVAISSEFDPHHVLDRIVRAACDLTGARYGALGVIAPDRSLSDFVTHGLDASERAAIGDPPHGRGLLGLVIDDPRPLRLDRIQDHLASYGFPAGHPPMTTFLGVPVTVRGEVFGNLYLTEKREGLPFTAEDASLVQALARVAGFTIANALAYARTESRRTMLEAIARVTEAAGNPEGGPGPLELVASAARTAFGCDTVGVLLRTHDLHLMSASDGDGAVALRQRLTAQGPAIQAAARGDRPRRFAWGMVVPLPTRVHPPVALVAAPAPVDPDSHDLVCGFAEQAGLALDRVQALRDREALAVLTDRDRIARDLHDLVIQRLFATGMGLEGLRHQVHPPGGDRLDRLIADLDATIRDIRMTIFELQRPVGSARAKILALVDEAEEMLGFRPTLGLTGPVDTLLTSDHARHLEAVLRELLSNAARHANATELAIEVNALPTEVTLLVTDDGKGLDGDLPHSGLANAALRARELGGDLEVRDVDPHGTRVRWTVPVR
ncbi:GAF domain-containing sensor histidine kinase [Nocardioides daeguensis]|uniref:Two-component system sensor histidine kinase DosT n=1 Tax=Nocardioides daeguensis TaxID=908359 RepID=A0ABP6URU5_9ACTN|nr:GAF domain-containing protein [Nocardioides daeguensis]MBV6728350.1 GAF domain-containing protein [Nocardioides daeguensis]MCR1773159.1 GAF domain-containing protein [Nocardioides daeguensis]